MRRYSYLFRDWYVLACLAVIAAWLCAWLVAFPNIYGWLTDDIYQFQRIMAYERGGRDLIDIPWFHAYDWFIVALPWLFHWSVPSYPIPQAWGRTGEFRALILWIIVLHAVILGMAAYLLRLLCANRAVAFAALVLFMTGPTFIFYSDLLDSRYLCLLAGIPSLVLLLKGYDLVGEHLSRRKMLVWFLLPGFLIGLGQSLHYTLLYFAGPICFVYWLYALAGRWRARQVWLKIAYFVAGVLLWFVPIQILSLCFHSWDQSMLGILWAQYHTLSSPYDRLENLATWWHFFLEDMGIPMILAVLVGGVVAYRDDLRPPYISRFYARLIVLSCAIAVAYIFITPAIPFYRQLSAYQLLFMLMAVIGIDYLCTRLFAKSRRLKAAVATILVIIAAWVPNVQRMPEVFVAAQGLGHAVNAAHKLADAKGDVYFIEFYDIDLHPRSVISRQDFGLLKKSDVIVTDFPTLFFGKYPDIFALMHDTGPVASYPTEWCTTENWVEERDYWNYRRYQDEPESCNAQVYSVAAIRREEMGKPLEIKSVRADSTLSPKYPPSSVFKLRNPPVPVNIDATGCCQNFGFFHDLWASGGSTRFHWFEVSFRHPAEIGAVTIVPANYFTPPDFDTVGRPDSVRVYGRLPNAGERLLWTGTNLRDLAIFTAHFQPALVSSIRLAITQPMTDDVHHAIIFNQRLGPSPVAGIEYIRFPGYVVHPGH